MALATTSRITPYLIPLPPTDRGRGTLLALVTALVAATPLVSAGDPGHMPMSIAIGHVYLTAGWFIVLAGWAIWNAWARPGRRMVGVVSLGLIVTAVLIAAGAASAPNRWLAWEMAWSWLSIAAAFVVVRHLANREDARRLLAVVLATGVAAVTVHAPARVATPISWPRPATAEVDGDADTAFAVQSRIESALADADLDSNADLGWLLMTAPVLAGLAIAGFWPIGRRPRLAALVPLVLILIGAACHSASEPPTPPIPREPAVEMIRSAPATGVGPGHYGRFAARWWPATDDYLNACPPDTYFALAATSGLPAAAALAITIALCILALLRTRSTESAVAPWPGPRWEFYSGGIIGLLAGLMLQVGDLPPGSTPAIRGMGIEAAVRALVWFITFACIEKAALHGRWPATAGIVLVAGAAALFDVMSALAVPFWLTAAVVLNLGNQPPPSTWARSRIGRLVPLLITIPLAVAFVILVGFPAITAANHVWQARLNARGYPAKVKAVDQADAVMKKLARKEAGLFVARAILRPLADAVKHNPHDAGPLLEQVPWWLAAWELGAGEKADENAIIAAQLVQRRDPESVAGFLAELQVRLRFAELTKTKRSIQFQHAEELIREVVKRDPARAARLRFQVARVCFVVKDNEKGKIAAEATLQLDDSAPGPRYRLRDDERAQVRKWLGLPTDSGGDNPAR